MSSDEERDEDGNSSVDSSVDLESYVKRPDAGHSKILERLKSMQLGDLTKSPADGNDRTVFYSLLSNATNGDGVLKQKLDQCVSMTRPDENDPECAIEVNLTPLLEGNNDNQVDIIKDMLDFKETNAREILLHPVIQTFLDVKWKKIRVVFFLTFASYILFLMAYSSYLANIFYRQSTPKR